MWEAKSPWSMRIDETVCGVLCQHPSCWQSTNRKAKRIPHVVPNIPPPEEIETDLPTVKVCNMLDDYGEDSRDQYPSKFEGKPAHMRTSLPLPNRKNPVRNSSIRVTETPRVTPASQTKRVAREKKEMNLVEVQEVFELEDLNSSWNDTFVSKQYYVWVPNPKKKGKKKSQKEESALVVSSSEPTNLSRSDSSQKVPPSGQVMVRDITETLIPKEVEYERLNTKSTDDHDFPILKKKRAMSPLMSGFRRTPYSKGSSYGFRSAGHGRPLFDAEGLEELLNLPRDVLIHVLNHSKSSDFTSRDRIREIIQRFLPPFERGFTDLSTESTDLLTQRKMNLHESKVRNIRQPNLMETKPVFYLDEDGINHEITPKGPGQGMPIFDSEFGSIRDLYMSGTREFPKFKNPLPPIGDTTQDISGVKIPSISLGLPELPSGIQRTKPFTYKRNTNQFDFTLAPVPTPPTSVRDIETPGSEHGTTIRVNVPSASERPPLDVATPVFPEEKKAPITVPITDTQTESQPSRQTTGDPLHAVSPAHSTKVPKAPATTPANQMPPNKQFNRNATPPKDGNANGQTVSRETTGLSSPKQPGPPANSPHFTPEHTGLDTIEEIRPEGTAESQPPLASRGGRSVRFAAEVPEVPPPPSSPQEPGDAEEFYQSTLTTPIVQDMDGKPQSGISILTAQNTFNTEQELSQSDLLIRSARKREISDLSTPEPWPQINESDFDMTPAPPPSSKQSMHASEVDEANLNINSRAAVIDNHSDRNIDSKTISISDLESIDSKISEKDQKKGEEMHRKSESPGPPPPSPEPKDPKKLTVDDTKSRKSKSRESTAMTPLPEESDQEESHDAQIRTIVVEVPPLGQPNQGKSKSRSNNNRTIDTFINVDIPAGVKENHVNGKINPLKDRKLDIAPTVAEIPEEETATINTRDVDMSIQSSLGGHTTVDPESVMSDVTSAGVDQSVGGNVSPTSTVTENKVNTIDLRLIGDPGEVSEAQETIPEGQETNPEKEEGGLEGEKTDITEDGGDHEGFKQELKEEYDKLSQET